MTCIIGLVEKGIVYMGGDSLSLELTTYDIMSTSEIKVFIKKIPKINKNIIVGCSGHTKYRQILIHEWKLPKLNSNRVTDNWIYNDFINSIKKLNMNKDAIEGCMLFGIDGYLYYADSNLAIIKIDKNFFSIGNGKYHAEAAMECLTNLSPNERILKSLEISEKYNVQIKKPFTILNNK